MHLQNFEKTSDAQLGVQRQVANVCYEGGDFLLKAVKEVFKRGSRLVVVHIVVVVIGTLIRSIVGRACLM
jgi:hypothetical protein